MKTPSIVVFQKNRAKIPWDDLRQFDGQWVAFSDDGQRVVASAPDIDELANRVRAEKEKLGDVVLEHIEFDTLEIQLGAAEFQ